jgi:hypothetical protein
MKSNNTSIVFVCLVVYIIKEGRGHQLANGAVINQLTYVGRGEIVGKREYVDVHVTEWVPQSTYITRALQCLHVPSFELGPPTPSPASEWVPPGTKGGRGHTRRGARGVGSSNSDDGRKSLALCLLFEVHCTLCRNSLKSFSTHTEPSKMINTNSVYVTYTALLSDTLCIHNEIYSTYH